MNSSPVPNALIDAVTWNRDGLVAAIAQDWQSGKILMQAWMNAEALIQTVTSGEVVYWSRSRQQLWHKGESSGNRQRLQAIHLDCDGDALVLTVEQYGDVACHTGRNSCFYRHWRDNGWHIDEPVLKNPADMYGSSHD